MNTGPIPAGRPAPGAWVAEGVGTANESLSTFVVLTDWRSRKCSSGVATVRRCVTKRRHSMHWPGVSLLFVFRLSFVDAGEWSCFRGPNGQGVGGDRAADSFRPTGRVSVEDVGRAQKWESLGLGTRSRGSRRPRSMAAKSSTGEVRPERIAVKPSARARYRCGFADDRPTSGGRFFWLLVDHGLEYTE